MSKTGPLWPATKGWSGATLPTWIKIIFMMGAYNRNDKNSFYFHYSSSRFSEMGATQTSKSIKLFLKKGGHNGLAYKGNTSNLDTYHYDCHCIYLWEWKNKEGSTAPWFDNTSHEFWVDTAESGVPWRLGYSDIVITLFSFIVISKYMAKFRLTDNAERHFPTGWSLFLDMYY